MIDLNDITDEDYVKRTHLLMEACDGFNRYDAVAFLFYAIGDIIDTEPSLERWRVMRRGLRLACNDKFADNE